MASATAAKPATLHTRYDAIFGKDGFLNAHNIERREEIELLGLGVISGTDTLFLGDPGVGKTWMIELLVNHCLTDMDLFTHLLAKDMSADEILGPRSLSALKNDQIRRMTAGYLPEAGIAYLDEIFKASPPMLNPLLDLLANRVLKMGGQVKDCKQLLVVVMSSNELPEREDLQAFRDRIGITKIVNPVRTKDGRRAVIDLQLDFQREGLDTSKVDPLTLADVNAIVEEVRQVAVPDAIREMMADAQQKWFEAGHPPSQRRVGQMWRVVKAHAWAAGRSEVNADDLVPCQHMAFNNLDHADSARTVIMEFASAFTRKAERLRQSFEPVLASMEELRQKIDAATDTKDREDLMDSGFKFIRQLRKLRKDGRAQIKEGEDQGQDVTSLETVMDEVERAYVWAEEKLTGTEAE